MDLQRCILAAVDLSEISPAVVASGLRLADKLGRPLLVVHFSDDFGGGDEGGPILPALRRRVADARKSVRCELDRLLGTAGAASANGAAAELVEGPTESCLANLVRSRQAELLVVGAPPPDAGANSFGSKVVRNCPCPVLVCRRPPPAGYRRILVGIDHTLEAERAWNLALDFAESGAVVTALHAAEGQSSAVLEDWVRARSRGFEVAARTEAGVARILLLDVAGETSADLVAVGRAPHGALHDLVLGSTAQTVAQQAPCDVLVAGGVEYRSLAA